MSKKTNTIISICLSLQRIVVNCFRECGNILRESREENAQGFTITQ